MRATAPGHSWRRGEAAFQDLSAGSYSLSLDGGPEFGETVGVCGGQDSSGDLPVVQFAGSGVDLDLPAEREYLCVTRTLTLGSQGEHGDGDASTGSLDVTFLTCPAGMIFETLDGAQCEQIVAGFDFGFQGDVDLHIGDAIPDTGVFIWDGFALEDDPSNQISWSPVVYSYPDGYSWYAISADGGPALEPHAGGFVLTTGQPYHVLTVSFFESH